MDKYDAKLFNDIYRELSTIMGEEFAIKMHHMYSGQQITFPVHLYNSERIQQNVAKEFDGTNIRELSRKYNYSEKTIRRMIRDAFKEEI